MITQILVKSNYEAAAKYRDDAITSLIPDKSLQGGIVGMRDIEGWNWPCGDLCGIDYNVKFGSICLKGLPEGASNWFNTG